MFARFFIDRPIFSWVLSLVIILVGGVCVFFLPMDQYPEITPPTVTVTATYPGANAQVVSEVIAAPIEEQVNGVENMMYMSSQSTNDGNYSLTVTFDIGTDLNTAQVLVQNRVALALPQLPAQVQLQGVSTKKRSPNILFAINIISPSGKYDDLFLSNYATINIRDELLRIKGVGDINIFGERDYAMRIWLDPNALATRGLTATDVVNAIKSQNVQVAAGQIGQEPVPPGQRLQLTMTTIGQLQTVRQFKNIILKTAPGALQTAGAAQGAQPTGPFASPVVRVGDVAKVELAAQNYDVSSRLDGQPSAGLAIFPLPGSNALDVANRVKARMEELRAGFPPGLDYKIIYDTTPFIQQSIDEVFNTLLIAVLLVALVVLLFLQDWKAMILPMIDVPVSLIGTFAVMAIFGFSLNNLTLFGLVLAIGIVVDDAIVVLENIERLIATGLDARTATIKAMDEITGPIVAITLVLSAVFLPSIFVPGLTGQFYRQFAVTIAAAMIISAMNAMTLTPSRAVTIFKTEEVGHGTEHKKEALPWWFFALLGGFLCVWLGEQYLAPWGFPQPNKMPSRWLTYAVHAAYFAPGAIVGGVIGWFLIGPVNAALGWVFRWFNRGFDKVTKGYGWVVGKMLRLAVVVLVVYGGLLFLTYWRVESAPTGFLPTQDQGYLLVNVQLPDAASVQRTRQIMTEIDKIARGDPHDRDHYPGIPGVAHTVAVSGTSFLLGTNGSNLGSMFVVLQPFSEREGHNKYDAVIAEKLQAVCARKIEGAIVSVFRAPPIRGLANAGGFQLQVELRGASASSTNLTELERNAGQLIGRIDRDPHFRGAFTLFRANTPQLFVDINRTKVESLQVPITDVNTTLEVFMGGLYVNQFNEFGRTWEVQAQAAPKFRTSDVFLKQFKVRTQNGQMVPLGTFTTIEPTTGPVSVMRYNMYISAAVNGNNAPNVSSGDVIREVERLAKETGVQYEWTGIVYLQLLAGNVTLLIFALGTVLVYLILAAKYESWKLPLAVILVVPLCMLAAITGMAIANLPVDIFVQIGLLVLVGLASKNAILIVEFARQLREEGHELHEAALEASRIRFRPIIMTSAAFILGVLPLVIATGAGAEMRQALGTAVFSGMIGVTLFGVLLTPVFFFALMWFGRNRPPSGRPAPEALALSNQVVNGEPERERGRPPAGGVTVPRWAEAVPEPREESVRAGTPPPRRDGHDGESG